MAALHIMHGFIGFGKTTITKKIARENSAVRFTYDDFNTQIFGRNPVHDGYGEFLPRIREYLWELTAETIANGVDVIIDHGHWTKMERAEVWQRAKQITPNVIFHIVECDIETAKNRTLNRTNSKENGLDVTENDFNNALKRFEPMTDDEMKNYEIKIHR